MKWTIANVPSMHYFDCWGWRLWDFVCWQSSVIDSPLSRRWCSAPSQKALSSTSILICFTAFLWGLRNWAGRSWVQPFVSPDSEFEGLAIIASDFHQHSFYLTQRSDSCEDCFHLRCSEDPLGRTWCICNTPTNHILHFAWWDIA